MVVAWFSIHSIVRAMSIRRINCCRFNRSDSWVRLEAISAQGMATKLSLKLCHNSRARSDHRLCNLVPELLDCCKSHDSHRTLKPIKFSNFMAWRVNVTCMTANLCKPCPTVPWKWLATRIWICWPAPNPPKSLNLLHSVNRHTTRTTWMRMEPTYLPTLKMNNFKWTINRSLVKSTISRCMRNM